MDGSQVTGTSSSYARKYALNGMFAIDDTKDSDATNTGEKIESIPDTKLNQILNVALAEIKVVDTLDKLKNIWVSYPMLQNIINFKESINNRKLDFK